MQRAVANLKFINELPKMHVYHIDLLLLTQMFVINVLYKLQ